MQNNNLKILYRPRITYIIWYLILYVFFGLFFFAYFRSYIGIVAIMIMTLFPIYSFMTLKYLISNVSISMFSSENNVIFGEDIILGFKTNNRTLLSSLKCKIVINIKNNYYNYSNIQTFEFPISAKSNELYNFNFNATRCGDIEFSIDSIEILGLDGLMTARISDNTTINVFVLPIVNDIDEATYNGLLGGMTDNEDDTRTGNEYTDISGIREYIPGDRIKDIHWKISAKKEKTFVKERIKSCESQMIIYLELYSVPEINDSILELYGNLINKCIREGVLVKTIFYNSNSHIFNEYIINSYNDILDSFIKIYESGYNAYDYKISEEYNLETYVKIGYVNGKVSAEAYGEK